MICKNCNKEAYLIYVEDINYVCSNCGANEVEVLEMKQKNFQLTPEQAKNLYEWIAREFISYENTLLHDTIKQLRHYVEKNELAKRDSSAT